MAWHIESKEQPERPVSLPASSHKIGNTTVEWFETEPGTAFIHTEGGTVDDRWFAEVLIREQLAACGIKQARYSFDSPQPNVVQVPRPPDDPGKWHSDDYPYLYNKTTGKLYVGDRGAYHYTMMTHPDLKYAWEDLGNEFLRGRFDEHGVEHYDAYGINSERDAERLQPHFDAIENALSLDSDQSHVKWSAEAPEGVYTLSGEAPWRPGQFGKGIITDFGVYHWSCGDDSDALPAHEDARRLVNGNEDTTSYFRINPDGSYTKYPYDHRVNHSDDEYHKYIQKIPGVVPQTKVLDYWDTGSSDPWGDDDEWKTASIKTTHWNDIMAKAKRLIQSGNVTLLRNGFNTVVGHVIGDHGEYQTEISRDDPNSRTITQWTCECPWDQYAFQRTRQWKKYEARPCAHVLATYWSSLGTPIDEEYGGPQQPGGMAQTPPQGPPTGPTPGSGAPIMAPQQPQAPMQAPMQGQPAPMPPTQMNMLPGAVPAQAWDPQAQQMPMFPSQQPPFMAPPGDNQVIPPYPMDPNMLQLPVSVPGGRPGPYPANPMQQPGTFSKTIRVGTGKEFAEGMTARLNEPTLGQSEGREGATDAGQWMEIPRNAEVEVRYQDPSTGWVEVLYPLRGGPMTSYHIRCFVEPEKLTPLPDKLSPFQNPKGKR